MPIVLLLPILIIVLAVSTLVVLNLGKYLVMRRTMSAAEIRRQWEQRDGDA